VVVAPRVVALAEFRFPDARYVAPPTPPPSSSVPRSNEAEFYRNMTIVLVGVLLLLLVSITVFVCHKRQLDRARSPHIDAST
jgi:hypothetical protein